MHQKSSRVLFLPTDEVPFSPFRSHLLSPCCILSKAPSHRRSQTLHAPSFPPVAMRVRPCRQLSSSSSRALKLLLLLLRGVNSCEASLHTFAPLWPRMTAAGTSCPLSRWLMGSGFDGMVGATGVSVATASFGVVRAAAAAVAAVVWGRRCSSRQSMAQPSCDWFGLIRKEGHGTKNQRVDERPKHQQRK